MTDRPQPDQRHIPVLLERTVELLRPALEGTGALLVDATLGHGGHSAAFLAASDSLRVIGIDRDPSALELARRRLSMYGDRVSFVHAVYDELPEALDALGVDTVQGILFDLGVSSMQLDDADRGFAYMQDAELDMRMDQSSGRTARDVVADYSADDLRRILREHGEERFAGRIAAAIVRAREKTPIRTTGQLARIVADAIPAAARAKGGHPAKRTFQALRIEVNEELDVLRRAIPGALARLAVGGRIVVLAYHSLEDRIVKQAFAALATDQTPVDLPITLESARPQLRLLVRGSQQALPHEIDDNARSASVRLRAAERIREAS